MSCTPDLSAPGLEEAGAPRQGRGRQDPGAARSERWPKLLAAAALLLLVGFIAYAVTSAQQHRPASSPSTLPALSSGKPAPAFSLARLGGGAPVDLASYRGKPTVVNFFASWCPDCRAELGAFGAASRADGSKVNFLGIDSNDSDAALARRLLATAGATYPVGVDPNGVLASTKYAISYLPVTFFLDAKGRVVGEAYGTQSQASLDRWVALLESGRTGRR